MYCWADATAASADAQRLGGVAGGVEAGEYGAGALMGAFQRLNRGTCGVELKRSFPKRRGKLDRLSISNPGLCAGGSASRPRVSCFACVFRCFVGGFGGESDIFPPVPGSRARASAAADCPRARCCAPRCPWRLAPLEPPVGRGSYRLGGIAEW